MTLNISDLKFNKTLKQLATNLDEDKNGKLNQEEFDLFKIVAKNVATDKAYNKAVSLFKPETTEEKAGEGNVDKVETTAPVEDAATITTSTAEQRKNVKHNIMKIVANDPEVTMANLYEKIASKTTGEAYTGTLADIKKIIDAVNGLEIKNKDDVDSIRKALRNAGNIETTKYHDIITLVEGVAEKDQVNAEYLQLRKIYDEIVAKNPEKTNIEDRLELVKKQMESDKLTGSYYTGKAFTKLINYAKEIRSNEIQEANLADVEYLDGKAKQKADKKASAKDKYTKDVIKKETTDYERNARRNNFVQRGETIGAVSLKEIKEGLPEKLVSKLEMNYLSKKNQNEDGTYNFKALYDIIAQRQGADYWVMKSESKEMNEYTRITKDFERLGITGLTEAEFEKLVEFCGGSPAKKDRSAETAAKEGLKGIAPGLAAGVISGITLDAEQTMFVNLGAEQVKDTLEALDKAGVKYSKVAGKNTGDVGIILHQEILLNTHAVTALAGAIAGFAEAFLATLIFGKERLENDCVSLSDFTINDEKYTNYEEYKKYVQDNHPTMKANALLGIVENFKKEDGTIDVAGYNSYLNEIAGIGSKLSCIELYYGGKDKKANETEEIDDTTEEPVVYEYEQGKEEDTPSKKVAIEIPKENRFDSSWPVIVGAYDCLEETFGSKNNAVRALKIAQGIKDVDLLNDVDYIKDLVELSNRRDWATMKQDPRFDFDIFYHYYSENDLIIKLPERFAGCTKDPDYNYGTDRANVIAPAAENMTTTNYRLVQGRNGEYYVTFYGPETKTVKSATEEGIQAAIEQYKEKNPGIELVERTK